MRGILVLALAGALGFGAGGAAGGAIWVALDAPQIGFAVMGAAGGASLGFVSSGKKRTALLALAGGLGFAIGFLGGFFILLALWGPARAQGAFIGALGGAVGGASLGVALRDRRAAVVLALAAAIGFGASVQAMWGWAPGPAGQVASGVVRVALWGAVGGASVGAALGCLLRKGPSKRARSGDGQRPVPP